ncbi:hypothetical protein [Microbacterium enclense]|uniref:hypothetical protein n=1 Tax=Microbacterium enclense TaxID=993073 RepID=UPI003F7D22C8
MLALATGGTWAAFRPDGELDAEVTDEILGVARLLSRPDVPDHVQALAGIGLALMASRGMSSTPGSDLVLAASSAQRLEHHDVALAAARAAVNGAWTLTERENAVARTLIARMTGDPADVDAALISVAALEADDPVAVDANTIRRVHDTAGTGQLRSAGALAAAGDRQGAARAILDDLGTFTASEPDQAYVERFRQTLLALAEPSIDVAELRSGLIELVRQVRRRQRFGMPAPASLAGIDMIVHLLLAGDADDGGGNVRANVIVELMEALADAGLSEADTRDSGDLLPAVAQARLADESRDGIIWPDMEAVLPPPRGASAVLFYTHLSLAGRLKVLTAYLDPSGGVGFRHVALSEQNRALLQRFVAAVPEDLEKVSAAELDALVTSMLPSTLRERLPDQPGAGLVLIPTGPLWTIPWEAATELRAARVTRAPSLTVLAGLANVGRIRRVRAVIDQHAPGGADVYDALYEARAAGALEVTFATAPASNEDVDLLLIYAHGNGQGLGFRTGVGHGFTAQDLGRASGASAVIVAACWSAGPPPLAFPASLPSTVLLAGAGVVAGGIWPLPALPTAQLLIDVIQRLTNGASVVDAVTEARRAGSASLFDTWGLAVHGGAG